MDALELLRIEIAQAEERYRTDYGKPRKSQYLHLETEQDLIESDPVGISSVIIEKTYAGPFPDLIEYRDVKHIFMHALRSWEELASYEYDWLESLRINVPYDQKPQSLDAFYLKQLDIFFDIPEDSEVHDTGNYLLEFSDMPHIETLRIHNSSNVDLSCLANLKKLKRLELHENIRRQIVLPKLDTIEQLYIGGSDSDLSSLEGFRFLKSVELYDIEISNLKFLEDNSGLERIAVSYASLTDISALDKFKNLKLANIRNNRVPIECGAEKREGCDILITEKDRDLYSLRHGFTFDVYPYICSYYEHKKNQAKVTDNGLAIFLPDIYTRLMRERTVEESVISGIQSKFEREFYEINPWKYGLSTYASDYKKIFSEAVISEYPFLQISEEMKRQMEKEMIPLASVIRSKPGRIVYVDNDVAVINVKVEDGNGEIQVLFNERSITLDDKDITLIYEQASNCLYDYPVLERNYRISITTVYGRDHDPSHYLYAIVMALYSAVTRKMFPEKTALAGKYSKSMSVSGYELFIRTVIAAAACGVEAIMYCGKKKKTLQDIEDMNIRCYKSIEELQNDMVC